MVITNAPAEPHADNPALQRLCGQPARGSRRGDNGIAKLKGRRRTREIQERKRCW